MDGWNALVETTEEVDPYGGDTNVLVALNGFCKPGRECDPGELLLPAAWCGRVNCTCRDEFHGTVSHGVAALGRVVRLRGVPRILAGQHLVTAMRGHADYVDPQAVATAMLDELAPMPEGTLVRREEGVLFPFPQAARITGPHTVTYGLDDAD